MILSIVRPRCEGDHRASLPHDAKTEHVAIEPERPLEIAHPKPNAADVGIRRELRPAAGPWFCDWGIHV
jgi:hypothetical protein